MTDLSKISSEDLLLEHMFAVRNYYEAKWGDNVGSAGLSEKMNDIEQELLRRLAVYDQIETLRNVPNFERDVTNNTKFTITNNTDKDASIIVEEIE
jgi:hypothetical protein